MWIFTCQDAASQQASQLSQQAGQAKDAAAQKGGELKVSAHLFPALRYPFVNTTSASQLH